MLRKVLEGFPGNTQKQSHSMTKFLKNIWNILQKYLLWKGVVSWGVLGNLLKSS